MNHATVSKGVNQLVEEGIVFKKRGIGMFVAEGARETLIQKRKEAFVKEYIVKLVEEAEKFSISDTEIIELIKNVKGRGTQCTNVEDEKLSLQYGKFDASKIFLLPNRWKNLRFTWKKRCR